MRETHLRNIDLHLLRAIQPLDEPILLQQHREAENPECLVEQTVGRALNATFQEAEDLIIKRFEKINLSDLSAEFHARLAESRGRHRKRRSHQLRAMAMS